MVRRWAREARSNAASTVRGRRCGHGAEFPFHTLRGLATSMWYFARLPFTTVRQYSIGRPSALREMSLIRSTGSLRSCLSNAASLALGRAGFHHGQWTADTSREDE